MNMLLSKSGFKVVSVDCRNKSLAINDCDFALVLTGNHRNIVNEGRYSFLSGNGRTSTGKSNFICLYSKSIKNALDLI